jgi:hypothetical protein
MSDDQKDIGLDLTQWAKVERVPEGEILAGVVGKDWVFVWRNGNGLKAYGALCPHLGAPLNEGSSSARPSAVRGIMHASTLRPAKRQRLPFSTLCWSMRLRSMTIASP